MKRTLTLSLALILAVVGAARAQTTNYGLGTSTLLEGPGAGSDSVVLAATSTWTATANTAWLHLSPANQSGTGSANVVFSYDVNPGATRSGTLTVANQTLTVTQAGSTYVAAPGPVIALVSSGLTVPYNVAVDGAGNVYIADYGHAAVKKWTAANNTVTMLVSSGLNQPFGVAVDGAGNVYIADSGNNAIKEWTAVHKTVTTLVSSGLNGPGQVAVDGAGNVYIADTGNRAIKKWTATNNTVTTLVSSGLAWPTGVAVDGAGNVFIADWSNGAIYKWTAAGQSVTTLLSGLSYSDSVAVDGAGNIYFAEEYGGVVSKWMAASNTVTTLVAGLNLPWGVAVDGAGNLYIADLGDSVMRELPHTFVDATAKSEGFAAGSDLLPVVLPATANLLAPFAPTSDQPWLTITGITNGMVSFVFSANTGIFIRSAHITLLGESILITQLPPDSSASLGTGALLEGPGAGSDSVVLGENPVVGTWTAVANASWLHLGVANQSGMGSTNVIFSYDANLGATRTGTLTIAGQTLTVTQAGSTYVAAPGPVAALVSSGLSAPQGVAVDNAGNVYIADWGNNVIEKWTATNNTVTTLVSSELKGPYGVAVDALGNVYIADLYNNAIYEWTVVNNTLTTLISSGLSEPIGVAVDTVGNVYIADFFDSEINELVLATNTLTALVSSGLRNPSGVAVDAAGNVYIADTYNNAIKEWTAANNTVTTLVSSGLFWPQGVAVDGSGNVYIADSYNQAIKKWTAANNTVTTLVSSGVNQPFGVAVDGVGNVYFSNTGSNAIEELPYAFVDPTAKSEGPDAGSDVLVVLAGTEDLLGPFAPVSDQPWLTISGITNGMVTFDFSGNASTSNRTAYISLLGESISVTQAGCSYSVGTTNLVEGPTSGSDSVVLGVNPVTGPWTVMTNAAWLHLSAANQSGSGSTNVIFSFDANPGPARSGTLTIAGQTLTINQAGSSDLAAPGPVTALVSSGLNRPTGVAVDGAGNVYVADTLNNAIEEWMPASNTVTPLVASGLNGPEGVAVDGMGNVYIADSGHNAIEEWTVVNNTVTTLVPSGLNTPTGVAVDGAGNVYIADTLNNMIEEWTATNNTLTELAASGLRGPAGVAVDAAGNVYIADTGNNAVKEWTAANNTVTTLVASELSSPGGVAVDGSGNVYIADTGNNAIRKWIATSNSVTTLVASGLSSPGGVAVDGAGNVYIADSSNNAIKELPHAFVNPTARSEGLAAGHDMLPVVLPATANLLAPFTPTSDQSWLTIVGITNGVVSFAIGANTNAARTAHITLLGESIPITQLGPYSLSTTNLLEGPGTGSDSVVLAATSTWTATANAAWLHLGAANQSGTGSSNVVFSYDANPGATRTGTLTIAGQTLTVTQAGLTYVAAPISVTALLSSGLNFPWGVGVDGAGNVYIADRHNNAIKEWTVTNNTVVTLVSSGLNQPCGLAVDGAGNVYIADTGNSMIKEWTAANNNVTTLVSSGLSGPSGVAVDGMGNLYIADTGNNGIKEWTAANDNVTTLASSGLSAPYGVAVDAAGNVYIADTGNNAVKEWVVGNNTVTTLVAAGLSSPGGVAVDAAGSMYIADSGNNAIRKWTSASNIVTTLVSSGLSTPYGVAVDAGGNVYIADSGNNAIKELPRAFVDPTAKSEGLAAGNDVLALVLPATENLLAPFTSGSSQPWLTITGMTNGVVSFAFSTNINLARTAQISLLGESISITQLGPSYSLGTTNLLEGPPAGTDSVLLAVSPGFGTWTAEANGTWLHLSAPNQSGTGSTNVVFSYDANPGATRTGTLTIASQTLTVTQAGSTYVAVPGPVTALVSAALNYPAGVAVDGAGDVYIADSSNNVVKEWMPANNTVITLVSSGLNQPSGVAVDGAGNVYIADYLNNAIKKWSSTNNAVTTLIASGLNQPSGVAVDGAGKVYIADNGDSMIKEWTAANNNVTTLVSSGLSSPGGVAVDAAGNVYIADTGNNAIKEWTAANNTITTLVASGLSSPGGVAVDGSGNVYIADTGNNAIRKWTAANNTITTLVASGLSSPGGVAVDGSGNVYIADSSNNAIKELPHAFVDPTSRSESANAGNDVLPVVLPATENLLAPFTPASDQSWLAIVGITNGAVNFACGANTNAARSAHITLLGASISITQFGLSYSLGTTNRLEGPAAGTDSVVLAVSPGIETWTATANATWLHLSVTNQGGTGSANVIFTYDANTGATRTGTLIIAGQLLTAIQAGSSYVPAPGPVTTLVSGPPYLYGLAVDCAGNVYFDSEDFPIMEKWTAVSNKVTTLIVSGLPSFNNAGVAMDGAGNLYLASGSAIYKWTAASNTISTPISSGLSAAQDVAVDAAGNIYIADSGHNAIKEWTLANNKVTTLVSSGLNHPQGVAVDAAGNVYIADTFNNAIKEWMAASNNVTTLVSSGLLYPSGVAVDGAGNVYIADTSNNAIKEWTAANNTVTTLVSSVLRYPSAVAVDGAGDVYIVDTFNNAIKELPRAFVDPTAKWEGPAAGGDALPVVLPATENLLAPFKPTSGQSWLTISGITNGTVSFAFSADTGSSNRTANITLLGQTNSVAQSGIPTLVGPMLLANGMFQFAFSNNSPNTSFTVLATTNLSLPVANWNVVGVATNIAPGLFQFRSDATNGVQQFYRVRSP